MLTILINQHLHRIAYKAGYDNPRGRIRKMHILSYILISFATSYSAISIFGLGWSTEPASFLTQSLHVGIITLTAGGVGSLPKKAELVHVCIGAVPVPALVFLLMSQGIIESGAYQQAHWLAIPPGGTVLAIVSFILSRRIRKALIETRST